MVVTLTQIQSDYLRANLFKERNDLYSLLLSNRINDKSFELESELIRAIQEWAEEKLLTVGFDVNNGMTEEGIILDNLQDELYMLLI